MTIVRTSSKFQIAIPRAIRSKLHLERGQELAIEEEGGRIVLTPIPPDPVSFLRGILKGEPSLNEELAAERRRDLERE